MTFEEIVTTMTDVELADSYTLNSGVGWYKCDIIVAEQERRKNVEFLRRLHTLSIKSDCDKIHFGALALSKNGSVVGEGWNHNPRPFPNYTCAEFCVGGIRKGVRSGTCVERCYAVHAEQHALITATEKPSEILVAGWFPDDSLFDNGGGFYCTVCSRLMAAAGVQTVSVWSKGLRKKITIDECWKDSYSIACR